MKLKHVLATLGLATTMALGVGIALNHRSDMKAASAEGEKTWMFRAQLDLAEVSPHGESPVFDVDGVQFHYWGTNVDEKVTAEFMEYDTFDYYGINVALRDDQIITGAQWIIHQVGVGDKYSVDINQFGDSSNDHLDKDSTYFAIQWQFDNLWSGDHWKFTNDRNWGYSCSSLQAHINGEDPVDFVKEPEKGLFTVRNLVHSNTSKWIEMISNGSVHLAGAFREMVDEDSVQYCGSGSNQWFYINETGTFDILLGNASVALKLHEAANDTYVYYVTDSDSATGDYIYSWGGSEQFGAFPGTAISALVAADKAEEVTGNGVIHFQGSETAKLIYKIEITKGYPTGDSKFMFNNGTDSYKSDERSIVAENAYWWTGAANNDAARALEFLIIAEAYRNGVSAEGDIKDYSVCGISKSNAELIIGFYNGLTSTQKTTYVDCSKIYTYKQDGTAGNELVLYSDVIAQLTKIATGPASARVVEGLNTSNTMVIVIITSVVAISVVGAFFIIRRRKHQ